MTAHSIVGPSGATRWMECPGSVQATRDLPNESSIHAAEGTAAHALAELALTQNTSPQGWLGETVEGFEVTSEMADFVQVYTDYCNAIPGHGMVEVRAEYPPEPELFGTADYVCVSDGTLYVVDLKYGLGVQVYADDNPQLMIYALMVFMGLHPDTQRKVDNIKCVIVQPRLDHISEFDMKAIELARWGYDVLDPTLTRALDPMDLARRSGDHCRWCLAKPTCPKLREDVMKKAKLGFGGTPPSLGEVSEQDMLDILANADAIIDYVKAVKQWAHDRLETGTAVPGWKLVNKRATRKWNATEDQIVAATQKLTAFDEKDLFESKIISPAKAEKLLGKELMQTTGLNDLIVKESSGFSMAKESDKRPAVSPMEEKADSAKRAFG